MVLIKFILIIAFMVALLRIRIPVGPVLILSSALTVFAFSLSNLKLKEILFRTVTDRAGITLLLTVYLIYILIGLMRSAGRITGLTEHIGVSKMSLVFPAMLIGMIPMPGGAVVSAPLVSQVGDKLNMDDISKAYVNYWFRHVWEFGWPMYPAIILFMNGFAGVSYPRILAGLAPFFLISILWGFFMIRKVKAPLFDSNIDLKGLIRTLYPILFLIVLYAFIGVDILISLLSAMTAYVLLERIPASSVFESIKSVDYIKMFLLIFGAMLFKNVVDAGQVFSGSEVIPGSVVYLLMVILPLIVGFATGLTVAAAGIVFPIFMSLIPDFGLPHVMILYASVFVGIMLSPTHLCLILSGEYFKVELTALYRKYLLPSVIPLILSVTMIIIYLTAG